MLSVLTKHYSGDKVSSLMGGDCRTYGDSRGAHRVLVRRPEGKRQLGRRMHRFESDIEMNRQKVE